ncbi:hypothetical protein Glove_167g96 [Diversispora epigaea]|uniref:PABS domain-containing protein n=1 Tax=Diversispora epigaea TaxID=1348612 RepID=A0A397IQD0_9GLOM|nr:hypothetical protein Glove_167g96 [Diversispora epigaea]
MSRRRPKQRNVVEEKQPIDWELEYNPKAQGHSRRTRQPQSISQTSSNLIPSEDHSISISQLWTLPRTTLLLMTPILASTILQVAPRYIEPVYGNIFPNVYFYEFCLISLIFGTIFGIGFVTKIKRLQSQIRDDKITRAIVYGIDLCGVLFAASPLMVKKLYSLSSILGPYVGPHITQLGLAYPIMFSLGFLNSVVCARNSHEQRFPIIRWISHVIIYNIVTQTFTFVLYSVETRGRSCHRLYFGGLALAFVSVVFKLLWNIHGEINLIENAGQRKKKKNKFGVTISSKIKNLSFILTPQILIFFFAIYNVNFNPQCNPSIIQNVVVNNIEYSIIARNDSITGWIEVLEEIHPRNIRVMRAGHSLLGGVYRNTWDSVFGSFYFMEAVRLIERKNNSGQERALQIGLGIGISASSLQRHQVSLDIIDLDPVVYEYAIKYFRLENHHRFYQQDGRKFINNEESGIYDYVLHDVFTGGSMPSELYSIEALEQIKRVMKEDGIMALNFVGSERWPHAESLALVSNTIKRVFPYIKCFKEGSQDEGTFQNMVFFASSHKIKFRQPDKEDFLDSDMREFMLKNFIKWPVSLEKFKNVSEIITDINNPLDKIQLISAHEHWVIMRELFPMEVWINY